MKKSSDKNPLVRKIFSYGRPVRSHLKASDKGAHTLTPVTLSPKTTSVHIIRPVSIFDLIPPSRQLIDLSGILSAEDSAGSLFEAELLNSLPDPKLHRQEEEHQKTLIARETEIKRLENKVEQQQDYIKNLEAKLKTRSLSNTRIYKTVGDSTDKRFRSYDNRKLFRENALVKNSGTGTFFSQKNTLPVKIKELSKLMNPIKFN